MDYVFPEVKDDYRIFVLSDTHGLLRPEAIKNAHVSDLIIHAGDIGDTKIIKRLEEIAPVAAVRGNVDTTPSLHKFPFSLNIFIGSFRFYLIHNIKDIDFDPAENGVHAVIFGHSHKAETETKNGVLYFNPGSAGKKRFHLSLTVGELKISKKDLSPKIILLEQ